MSILRIALIAVAAVVGLKLVARMIPGLSGLASFL